LAGKGAGMASGLIRPLHHHGVHREAEGGGSDLLIGVLSVFGQTGETANPHHDDAVTTIELDAGRDLGNGNIDPEPRPHRPDRGDVGGVATGLNTLRHQRLHLFHAEDAPRDVAVPGEHAVRQGKTKINLTHLVSPSFFCC